MKDKKIRKHQGIHQTGGKRGHLKKGYKYSGQRTKSGLPIILKVNKSKKQYNQRGGRLDDIFSFLKTRLLETNIIDEEGNVLWDYLTIDGGRPEDSFDVSKHSKEYMINTIFCKKYYHENECKFLDEKKVMERWNGIVNFYKKKIMEVFPDIKDMTSPTGDVWKEKLEELMKTDEGLGKISKLIDFINEAYDTFLKIKIFNFKPDLIEDEIMMYNKITNKYFKKNDAPTFEDLHEIYRENYNNVQDKVKRFIDKFWISDNIRKNLKNIVETIIPLGQYRIKLDNIRDFKNEYNQISIDKKNPKKNQKTQKKFIEYKITDTIIPLFDRRSKNDWMAGTPMSFIHYNLVSKLIDNLGLSDDAGKGLIGKQSLTFEGTRMYQYPNIRTAFCTNWIIFDKEDLRPVVFNMFTLFHELGHILGFIDSDYISKKYNLDVNIGDLIVNLKQFWPGQSDKMIDYTKEYTKMLLEVKLEHEDFDKIGSIKEINEFIKNNTVLNHFFNNISDDAFSHGGVTPVLPRLADLVADVLATEIYVQIFEENKLDEIKCFESIMAILNNMGGGNEDHFHAQTRKIWGVVINQKINEYYKNWIKNNTYDEIYDEIYNIEERKRLEEENENIWWQDNPRIWGYFEMPNMNHNVFNIFFKKYFRRLNVLETNKIMEIFQNYIANDENIIKQSKLKKFKEIVEKRAHHTETNDNDDDCKAGRACFYIEKGKYDNLIEILTSEIKKLSIGDIYIEVPEPRQTSSNGGKRKTKKNQKNKKLSNGGKRKTKKNQKNKKLSNGGKRKTKKNKKSK